MKIGIDVDGVIASFYEAYEALTIKHDPEQRNLFPQLDPKGPPTWHWPQHYGYSEALMDFFKGPVWGEIKSDPAFWFNLPELPDMAFLRSTWVEEEHDVYFITDRSGIKPKHQTEQWLREHGIAPATVLISADKAGCCKALKLDAYIDDKAENCLAVLGNSPSTNVFMPDRLYNRHAQGAGHSGLRVVENMEQAFRELGLVQ